MLPPPAAQVVANAFVNQYYHVLHHAPDHVYRFYQESSKLGRPDHLGATDSITTMQAINEKILSMDYSGFRAEIKTVDAQESLNGGVIVLVMGYLTGKDGSPRDFAQTFFLATQDKGYFVLNDIFRYVEDDNLQQKVDNHVEQESRPVNEEQPSSPPPEEDGRQDVEEEEPVQDEAPEEEVIDEVPSSSSHAVVDPDSTADSNKEEAPKKSYAMIVKVSRENASFPLLPTPASGPTSRPAPPIPPAPSIPEQQTAATPAMASISDFSVASSQITETNNVQATEDTSAYGCSVYVKNLPFDATSSLLEDELKKFGPIKPDGIQIRFHKLHGFYFGFVEFEVASAAQSAIEASPVLITGHQVYIEGKRPAGSRGYNRGRFLPFRGGGFGNDGMREHGNYGGWGYGRGDYIGRVDFGGRGGGRAGPPYRGGGNGVYQRIDGMRSEGGRRSRSGTLAPIASSKNVAGPMSNSL